MLRRDFVSLLISLGAAPQALLAQQSGQPQQPLPAPVPWPTGLNPQTPVPHTDQVEGIAQPEPIFFTSLQMATLVRLCDVLLPPIGMKPGALQAQTPDFLDFLISASPAPRQKLYTDGLIWLSRQAQLRFKASFASLNNSQVDAILKPWLQTWMEDHPPQEPHAHFIHVVHHHIRVATINSKPWSDASSTGAQEKTPSALYWKPLQVPMDGRTQWHATLAEVKVTGKPVPRLPEYAR